MSLLHVFLHWRSLLICLISPRESLYRQGESIGCRIGNLPSDSLGAALGFQKGDIISSVNNKPVATTTDRFNAYKEVTSLKTNDVISVTLFRNTSTAYHDLHPCRSRTFCSGTKASEHAPVNQEITKERLKHLRKKKVLRQRCRKLKRKKSSNY